MTAPETPPQRHGAGRKLLIAVGACVAFARSRTPSSAAPCSSAPTRPNAMPTASTHHPDLRTRLGGARRRRRRLCGAQATDGGDGERIASDRAESAFADQPVGAWSVQHGTGTSRHERRRRAGHPHRRQRRRKGSPPCSGSASNRSRSVGSWPPQRQQPSICPSAEVSREHQFPRRTHRTTKERKCLRDLPVTAVSPLAGCAQSARGPSARSPAATRRRRSLRQWSTGRSAVVARRASA